MTSNTTPAISIALTDLDKLPIWAARGAPETVTTKDGKPVSLRAPINPRTGKLALNDKPATWGSRASAEKLAAGFPEDRQPGVGLMLGERGAPDGYTLAGLDLDGCRDPESGAVDSWAEDAVWRFNSYSEASPSGTGLHVLFYARSADIEALREDGLVKNLGKTFSRGEHVEMTAFFGGKFMTVTGAVHDDALFELDAIRPVGLDVLRWFLAEHGPEWEVAAARTGGKGKDESGSGFGFRLALDLMRDGLDDDAVREAIEADEGEAGAWWASTDDRQRDRCVTNARREVDRKAVTAASFEDLELPDPEEEGAKGPLAEMNARYAFTYIGSSAVVADFAGESVEFRTAAAFKEMTGIRRIGGQKAGAWWMENPKRRTYDKGVIFDPSGEDRPDCLNLWTGWAIEPDPGADCGLILSYIRDVLADGNPDHADYILSWLADIVQHPAQKPGVGLVLKGLKGTGKDTLAVILGRILGIRQVAHYTSSGQLTSNFNAQLANTLLAHSEEASWGGDRQGKGPLQSLITSPTVRLERKGVDAVEIPSFHRVLFTTNEDWSVPVTSDDRRYAVFEVSATRRGDRAYWDALYSQIDSDGPAGLLAFLRSWEINVVLRNPPQTAGLAGEKLAGLRNADAWWYALLTDGALPGGGDFDSDWADEGQTVEKSALRSAYESWWRNRRWDGECLSPAAFGKALARLCPDIREAKPRTSDGRVRCYRVPSLPECRALFTSALNIPPEVEVWGADHG